MDVDGQGAAAIRAEGLIKEFAGSAVLRGVDLDVGRGEFVAIMGPSGSGKSTLMYCLAGLEAPTSGTALTLGVHLAGMNRTRQAHFRRDHLGFIFQSYNLIPSLSAVDNVALPHRLAGRTVPTKDIERVLSEIGLSDHLDAFPSQLSGGQQQRVAIARVLAGTQDLVFCDEPTGALDSRSGSVVLDLLAATSREAGRTLVMVTHEAQIASRADRVLFLYDGVVAGELRDPTPDQIAAAMVRLQSDGRLR